MRRKQLLKPRQEKVKRHSQAERESIIKLFVNACNATSQKPQLVAKNLGVSLPTINRWRREQHPSLGMPTSTFAQNLSIDSAIARLIDIENEDRLSFLEALFKFVSWLRWPTKPGDHPAAITVCVVTYLSQRNGAITFEQLPSEDLQLLHRHLKLDTIRRMFSDDVFAMPSFTPWNFDNQRYDRSDLLGDITWFLLSYEAPTSSPRDAPSLNKAYFAVRNNVFRHRWRGAHRTFRSLWLEHGAAAPFHYVERFHPSLEFAIDPSANDFALSVDELIRDQQGLRDYFARCSGAIQLLMKRLDTRAVQALRFPSFPDSLTLDSIVPPRLPERTDEIMNRFGRPDKRR